MKPLTLLAGVTALTSTQTRHPGGHNWPDMEVVVDFAQTEVEDDGLYLISVPRRSDNKYVNRLRHKNGSEFWVHPAVSTVHGHSTVRVFGKELPCTAVEFSDNIYKKFVVVHGRVVGIWAGGTP